jgi:SAM-dependent methyltransferase
MSQWPPYARASWRPRDPVDGIYDDELNATRDLDARILRDQASEITGRDVLELGCGTGKNSEWLALYARHLLCLEFSASLLEKARARLAETRHVTFLHHDVRDTWPVPEASRDRIVSNLVLEHIQDLRPLFVQVARVLRPGGSFVLSEVHPFRQLQGAQARFVRVDTTQTVQLAMFQHDVAEYVNAGLAAGLTLTAFDEWRDAGVPLTVLPRLLSISWLKRA